MTGRSGLLRRLGGVVRRNPVKSTLFLGGVGVAVHRHLRNAQERRELEQEALSPKKQVLVIPFHRIKLVEKRRQDFRSRLATVLEELQNADDGSNGTSPVEMEVQELVDLIHTASSDSSIVALYGTFGSGFEAGGWAHVEEVRNALRVFRESTRIHREPNLSHAPLPPPNENPVQKTMYAYADTFSSPLGSSASMKQYYLASVFTHIQLQPMADLSLFGLHATNLFFRDFLDKYGIQAHVFKHGPYKNFANQFTDRRYTKEHRENVQNIIQAINAHFWDAVYHSRKSLAQYDLPTFSRTVQEAGSLSADTAHEIGLVDYTPSLDPLHQLVLSNKSEIDKQRMKKKWGKDTDMDHFKADRIISITEYQQQQRKKKKARQTSSEGRPSMYLKSLNPLIPSQVRELIDRKKVEKDAASPNDGDVKHSQSVSVPSEKIAVYKITGAITETTARRAEQAIRKLKDDDEVKCLVLRVDSPGGSITACETILQELKDLPQNVVVSFGNVSASGGYYISSAADRIFASSTTVTGSIGVFMLRLDLRNLASSFGITSDSVPMGNLSGSHDPLTPMNKNMKENFTDSSNRAYHRFKSLVSNGRSMDMDTVESVAQGRVWTGQQAKELGLIDELGSLNRAIAYAQREHTETGEAQVVEWPPKRSISELLWKKWQSQERGSLSELLASVVLDAELVTSPSWSSQDQLSSIPPTHLKACSGIMLTIDENSAIRCLLNENDMSILDRFPDDFWL